MSSAVPAADHPAAPQPAPAPDAARRTASARRGRAQSAAVRAAALQQWWTSTEPGGALAPVIQLLPVPNSLPPFDDELPGVRIPPQRRPTARPAHPTSSTPSAPRTITDSSVPSWSEDPDVGIRRTRSSLLPDPGRTGQALARALTEVLGRARPLAQLRAHCSPDVFAGLQVTALFPGQTRLTSVRVSTPSEGVAEVCAVLRCGPRARAMAFRMDGVDRAWRITALQVG